MVDWDTIIEKDYDQGLAKEKLGLKTIETKVALLDDIKSKTDLIDELKTKLDALEKKKKEEQTDTKTKGRSVWFALSAIGAIMTGTVLSNDPIALLENPSFQTILGALVAYATGRQIFKHAVQEKKE